MERFVGANYRGYAYTYAIISGPLPVTGYVATLSLTEREGGGARARWESEFTPEGADEATLSAKMEAFYHQGFANLASVIAARRAAAERRKRPGTPV
ncbi:MAG: SRPBCC family protein [Alphaproteobacteria bacterium]|nr:SRPBCC family protein [Alphaproteobacteria bacterium]